MYSQFEVPLFCEYSVQQILCTVCHRHRSGTQLMCIHVLYLVHYIDQSYLLPHGAAKLTTNSKLDNKRVRLACGAGHSQRRFISTCSQHMLCYLYRTYTLVLPVFVRA